MPPQRQLGLVTAASLVVASMIGSGVFTTSGFLLADLHTPARVLAVWVGGGLLAMMGALCYGALARRFPESGGEYLFLSRTVHPAAGYLAGWLSLLVGFSAPMAAVALAFGNYTKEWFPFSSPALTGTVLVGLFALLHAAHVQRGAWVQNVVVAIKLALIAVLIGWAGSHLRAPALSAPPDLSVPAFAVSLVWVSFSYSGWNAAVYIASEVRAPERNLPRAMALGTGVVMVLYVALNAVFVFAAPVDQLAGKLEVGRVAAEALGGKGVAEGVTAVIALALATSVSSITMAGPRVYACMAEDRCMPSWFRSREAGPPRRGILLQTLLAIGMLWTATFESLLTYIGFSLGLCTAASVAGLIRLRLREGPQLRVPGWPILPGLFVASVAAISLFTMFRRPVETGIGLATLVAGWISWRFVAKPGCLDHSGGPGASD
ncbi:MAG: APC family permease [Verrucomicrobiia bacterium]